MKGGITLDSGSKLPFAPNQGKVLTSILGEEVSCHRCKHTWRTKSQHVFVSCPSCLTKVKVKKTRW